MINLVQTSAQAPVDRLDQAEALGQRVAAALQQAGARPVPKEV